MILQPLNAQGIIQLLQSDCETHPLLNPPAPPPPVRTSALKNFISHSAYWILQITGHLLRCTPFTSLSRRALVTSIHCLSDYKAAKVQRFFQNNLLAPARNVHRKDTSDIYLHNSVVLPSLPYFHPHPTKLQFFHGDGLCRGMCLWFAHLYFHTRAHFAERQEHLRAIGLQFESGANRQAALIQAMRTVTTKPVFDFLPLQAQLNYRQIDPSLGLEEIAEQIMTLEEGVYGIYLANHIVLFIKESHHQQFFFDPSQGTIAIPTRLWLERALCDSFSRHPGNTEITIDRYSAC